MCFCCNDLCISVLQVRDGQQSITGNLWSLIAYIYYVTIIVTGGFPRNLFHCYFLEIFLNYLELVFLEFEHFYKTLRISLFSFYLFTFYSLLCNHSVYQHCPPFRTFSPRVNTLDESVLLLLVVLQSLCILMLSAFCTFHISKEKTKSFNLTSNTLRCKI